MQKRVSLAALILIGIFMASMSHASASEGKENKIGKGPVKVYILAGQSNMEGHAQIRTIDWLGKDPDNGNLLGKIKAADGSWIKHENVWIYYKRDDGPAKKGPVTVGYGASDNEIGPELMFGTIIGEHYDNQILLIKTAWGGKSLAVNFRPPSAGPLPMDKYNPQQKKHLEESIAKGNTPGKYYNEMITRVKDVLANMKKEFPAYDDQAGYEVAGLVWFQGWNDMIDTNFTAEYPSNLEHFIKDVRKDLQLPNLPFIVAEMGVDGKNAGANIQAFRKAEAAGLSNPEFKDNAVLVNTADLWDEHAAKLVKDGWEHKGKWTDEAMHAEFDKMGSQPAYHYLGSGKILCLIGNALAQAAIKLSGK